VAIAFTNRGRLITITTANAHVGWESVDQLLDGDVFFFKWNTTGHTVGLGRGLGPGNFFAYASFIKYAITLASLSSMTLHVSGSLVSTIALTNVNLLDWWSLRRNGNTVSVFHLNTDITSFTVDGNYKVGHQSFGLGAKQVIDANWPIVAIGNSADTSVAGTYTESNIAWEIADTAGTAGFTGLSGLTGRLGT
jgi:hypothetical protein